METWAEGVNKNILRDGTSWSNPIHFIEDETRSGKKKRRLYATQEKKKYSISMIFKEEEYHIFKNWFENTICHGLLPFSFPQIDSSDKSILKVYKFTKDGSPDYSNKSGKYIQCNMEWEEA